ncbi:hypothetical protein BpHYR1_019583 [Brachionus plicatilis]|uniref:Uncharacterized protein n=1 Tax=Brachionus plicatilis TaxID=10195 RepID=A0A3M7SHL7_BRAPC|nr:hypothetical protein BpHYR1_019583 [Brachionus plicatilis]
MRGKRLVESAVLAGGFGFACDMTELFGYLNLEKNKHLVGFAANMKLVKIPIEAKQEAEKVVQASTSSDIKILLETD